MHARAVAPDGTPGAVLDIAAAPATGFENAHGDVTLAPGVPNGALVGWKLQTWKPEGGPEEQEGATRLRADGTAGPAVFITRGAPEAPALAALGQDLAIAVWSSFTGARSRLVLGDSAGAVSTLSPPRPPAPRITASVQPRGCVASRLIVRARARVPAGARVTALRVALGSRTLRLTRATHAVVRVSARALGRRAKTLSVSAVTGDGVRTTASRTVRRCVASVAGRSADAGHAFTATLALEPPLGAVLARP